MVYDVDVQRIQKQLHHWSNVPMFCKSWRRNGLASKRVFQQKERCILRWNV